MYFLNLSRHDKSASDISFGIQHWTSKGMSKRSHSVSCFHLPSEQLFWACFDLHCPPSTWAQSPYLASPSVHRSLVGGQHFPYPALWHWLPGQALLVTSNSKNAALLYLHFPMTARCFFPKSAACLCCPEAFSLS